MKELFHDYLFEVEKSSFTPANFTLKLKLNLGLKRLNLGLKYIRVTLAEEEMRIFMEVLCANSIKENPQKQLSKIFADGFFQWLRFFSKDKQKLADTLEHMFNPDVFYAAVVDDKIAGMAALNNGQQPTVRLSKKEFKKHLGFIMGTIAYKILKHEFEEKQYPFEMKSGTGYVEFVATSPEYRGKGAATAIIKHFFSFEQYSEYVLEVADTNTNAVRLYENLGFKEFKRIEMKNKKQSGVNFLLYMKYVK